MYKKGLGAVVIVLFISFSITPIVNSQSIKEFDEESIENDDSRDLNLGFILCRVTYIDIGIWWETGFHGQNVELKDLDTGEVIAQGKTGFFGFIFFTFLPIGHDYRITAYTDYGIDSRKIEDLGLFQKVKICFIN